MPINLYTLIRNLLITFTRDIKLVEFARVLSSEVETAHNAFMLQVPDWKYKVNANASVISLQHHIKRELDVDALITELDGKPIDFLVTVTGFVDEIRLKALLDNYKLAGRSYVFKVGSVAWAAAFTNHLCEDIREGWTAAFSDYVCESDGKNLISALCRKNGDGYEVVVSASSAVKSALSIDGIVRLYSTTAMISGTFAEFSAEIPVNQTLVTIPLEVVVTGANYFRTSVESIYPTSDSYYQYIAK
jgi:hypothetical protein